MTLFSGTGMFFAVSPLPSRSELFPACFSPSVDAGIKTAWKDNGGKIAASVNEQQRSDWFFCDGMSDPWLPKLRSRPIAVFHAGWISASAAASFPLSRANYVLDDRFETLAMKHFVNTSESDLCSISNKSYSNASEGDDSSATESEYEVDRSLSISAPVLSKKRPRAKYEDLEEIERASKRVPSIRTHTKSHSASGDPSVIRPTVLQSLSEDTVSRVQNYEAIATTNLKPTFFTTTSTRKDTLRIELVKLPRTNSRGDDLGQSMPRLPSDLWATLEPARDQDNSLSVSTIPVSAVLKALGDIPISDVAFFKPGGVHLGKRFIYVDSDRRRTI